MPIFIGREGRKNNKSKKAQNIFINGKKIIHAYSGGEKIFQHTVILEYEGGIVSSVRPNSRTIRLDLDAGVSVSSPSLNIIVKLLSGDFYPLSTSTPAISTGTGSGIPLKSVIDVIVMGDSVCASRGGSGANVLVNRWPIRPAGNALVSRDLLCSVGGAPIPCFGCDDNKTTIYFDSFFAGNFANKSEYRRAIGGQGAAAIYGEVGGQKALAYSCGAGGTSGTDSLGVILAGENGRLILGGGVELPEFSTVGEVASDLPAEIKDRNKQRRARNRIFDGLFNEIGSITAINGTIRGSSLSNLGNVSGTTTKSDSIGVNRSASSNGFPTGVFGDFDDLTGEICSTKNSASEDLLFIVGEKNKL